MILSEIVRLFLLNLEIDLFKKGVLRRFTRTSTCKYNKLYDIEEFLLDFE